MNREERVRAVLDGGEPDRLPVSVWMHMSQYDQDPRSLAEVMVEFNEEYDYDFIKMMPFGAYTTSDWGVKLEIYCDKYREVRIVAPAFTDVEGYKSLEVLPPTYGTWGKTLQITQWVSKLAKPGTPFIQTIFSPTTTLHKLVGDRLLNDMRACPAEVHQALETITETTIGFVKANIEAGVHGFFFATQCATYDKMDDLIFAEFCKPYDLRVINSYIDETWFNVLHIHGKRIMFDTLSEYPCPILNWHDRQTRPSFEEARRVCSKVFLGGLREGPSIVTGGLEYDSIMSSPGIAPREIKEHIFEAIRMVEGKGIIIGPGCVADPKSAPENMRAVREAAGEWSNVIAPQAFSIPV